MQTCCHQDISDRLVANYMDSLTNKFFKILPLSEDECATLPDYLDSFLFELVGNGELVVMLNCDAQYMELTGILRRLIDCHSCVKEVKREVFHAIRICKTLSERYSKGGGDRA